MQVGIRELKARLSELVERAAEGETIRITDRGKLKAELSPPSARSRLEQAIAEGRVTPPKTSGGLYRPDRKMFKSHLRTEDAIAEDRSERF